MSEPPQVTYQPDRSDIGRMVHDLANEMQRCIALRIAASENPAAAKANLAELAEAVQSACRLVHQLAERVQNLPCARCTQQRPVRASRV